MAHLYSPTQLSSFFKSFFVIFAIQALVVLLTPYDVVDPIRPQILIFNISTSLILGWILYKRASHLTFTYNENDLTLRRGKSNVINRRWSDFSKVSLARTEHGEFSVRLYNDGDFLEITVSKLKLDPFMFRDEAKKLIESHR